MMIMMMRIGYIKLFLYLLLIKEKLKLKILMMSVEIPGFLLTHLLLRLS